MAILVVVVFHVQQMEQWVSVPGLQPFFRATGNGAVLKLGRISPLEYLPMYFNRHQS